MTALSKAILAILPAMAASAALQRRPTVIDSFDSPAGWSPQTSAGTSMRLAPDSGYRGRALRVDFDLSAGGSQATISVRKAVNVDLPTNYELSFRVRGDAPASTLELRLVDAAGANVWASTQPFFEFPRAWAEVVRKKRHITFVSGPRSSVEPGRIAAIEIAISSPSGGKGAVWIDELVLRPREPAVPYALKPAVTASSESLGFEARRALDADSATLWRSAGPSPPAAPVTPAPRNPPRNAPAVVPLPPNATQAVVVDFLRAREFGGLTIDWERDHHASDYTVALSADGKAWDTRHRVTGGNGGRDHIYLPESDARFVRLALERGPSDVFGLREVSVEPLEWSASKNAFFAAVAKDAPPGSYPRYLAGVQSYWTAAGSDGDRAEVLVNEDGMVEARPGGFSIEPFVYVDGRLFSWRDVEVTTSLGGGPFPEPSVSWKAADWTLTLAPIAVLGGRDSSTAYLQYRLANTTSARRTMRLYVAIRPFQVIPPWHVADRPGGAATVRELAVENQTVRVNGEPAVVSLTPSTAFGAAAFSQGNIVDYLRDGRLPAMPNVQDPFGSASGALAYTSEVDSGAAAVVELAVPLHAAAVSWVERERVLGARAPRDRQAETRRTWREAVERVTIELPPSASRILNSVYANLGFILVHRDHAALQSGSRSADRSRIRDGARQATALLRMGRADVARDYLEWYAGFQYTDGRIPCCVDARGADPAPEHDSQGEFIHLAAEYWHHTHDRVTTERLWPNVLRAAGYIDSLRQQRRTAEYQSGDKRVFYGILPPSAASGRSAKPTHAYGDDFAALTGLNDAAELATVLGQPEAFRLAAMRDEFRRDLYASMQLAMAHHRIDFIPPSPDLADVDAASALALVAPLGEPGLMPETIARGVERTFERYRADVAARGDDTKSRRASAADELRSVGVMLRRGRRDSAHVMLDALLKGQRPAAWLQWAEMLSRDSVATAIGDMPNASSGSRYIEAVLDMLAYEHDSDSSLVVAAGVPEPWVTERPGVTVRRLSTHYGPLSFTIRNENGSARVSIQAGIRLPPGGIIVHPPFARPPREMLVNGVPMSPTATGGVAVRTLPAEVVFRR